MKRVACGVRVICDEDDKFSNFDDSLAYFDEMRKDAFECGYCDFTATKSTDGAEIFQHIKKKCCKGCGKKFTCPELFESHSCNEPQRTLSPGCSISLQAIKQDYQPPRKPRTKYGPPPRRKKRPKKLCLCCDDDEKYVECEKCAKVFECKNALEGHFVAHLEAMDRLEDAEGELCSPLDADSDSPFNDYGHSEEEASQVLMELVAVQVNSLQCEVCQITCPDFDSLRRHWHVGSCEVCGCSMRCSTEVHAHHRSCKKLHGRLVSSLLTDMHEVKGSLNLITQHLMKGGEDGAPVQELSSDEEAAASTACSTSMDTSMYFVKRETVLVPEQGYCNVAPNLVIANDNVVSPPVGAIKLEPDDNCTF